MQRFHRSTRFAAAEYLDTRPAAAHTGEEHLFDMPSATNLADFTRCPHRIFLDANGDGAEKLPPSPELQRLWEEGRAHETNIIATLDVAAVDRPTKAERIIQTLTLMRNGAELIYHGLLAVGDLVGEPDLLKKVAHETTLGSYGYVPVDVKNGRATKSTASATTKPAYAIQLCAYAELLETAQGWCPDTAFIVDQHGAWQTVDLAVFAPRYAEIRTRFVAIQAGVEPTIPGWKTACAQCAWQSHCLRVLHETDDLTTMAGIGEPKREKLFTIGIRTVADLAVADADEVMKVRGLGKSARFWPLRARAVKTGQPVLIEPWAPPVVDYELSYDVEKHVGAVRLLTRALGSEGRCEGIRSTWVRRD